MPVTLPPFHPPSTSSIPSIFPRITTGEGRATHTHAHTRARTHRGKKERSTWFQRGGKNELAFYLQRARSIFAGRFVFVFRDLRSPTHCSRIQDGAARHHRPPTTPPPPLCARLMQFSCRRRKGGGDGRRGRGRQRGEYGGARVQGKTGDAEGAARRKTANYFAKGYSVVRSCSRDPRNPRIADSRRFRIKLFGSGECRHAARLGRSCRGFGVIA